jgi:hypothetical protein
MAIYLAVDEATPTVEIWWGIAAMAVGSVYLWLINNGRLEWAERGRWVWRNTSVWSARVLAGAGLVVFVLGVVSAVLN